MNTKLCLYVYLSSNSSGTTDKHDILRGIFKILKSNMGVCENKQIESFWRTWTHAFDVAGNINVSIIILP